MKLKNRTALVTGASRGIGRAIALEFAKEGADVIVNYFNSHEKALEVTEEASRYGVRALAVQADISKRADIERMSKAATDAFGHVDILVNNAGIYERCDFLDVDEDLWHRTVDTNLMGAFFCSQIFGAHMTERQYGNIINIASDIALQAGTSKNIHYGVSKAGIVYITRSLALALAPYVNVNCIAPGYTTTDMARYTHDPALKGEIEKTIPLGRVNEPQDIANAALFLASEGSRNITGQILVVNGGRGLQAKFSF